MPKPDGVLGGKDSIPTSVGIRARCGFVECCRRDGKEKLVAQAVFSLSAESAEGLKVRGLPEC